MSIWLEEGAGILNHTLIYLPEVGSTNAWAKENLARFADVGAVYSTHQTAGRGRLGRTWTDAPGQGLYYSVVLKTPLAQPGTLPLYASLAAASALKQRYNVDCQIKWPNDLLLNGKKIVGILCEIAPDGHSIVCGIGFNLAQPQSYFTAQNLPHGTSLTLQGVAVDPDNDPAWLAAYLTEVGFGTAMADYAAHGFTVCRDAYKAVCVNLQRAVTYDGGQGIARDVDEDGRLVVHDDTGDVRVFTGEVSVRGIYGKV